MSGSVRTEGLFRREALRRAEGGGGGEVLRLAPSWVRNADAALAAVLALVVALLLLVRVDAWATSIAVVRFPGWTEVTAVEAGTVREIAVAEGQRVAAGDVLLRMHDRTERQEESRLEREYELLLVRLLARPGDDTARVGLARLRAERLRVQGRRGARIVRAPAGGLVHGLRVHIGQPLLPGDRLLSIGASVARAEVLAFFPGEDAPRLAPGRSARLELFGYRDVRIGLAIAHVSPGVVEASAARRLVGAELGDAVPAGPSALARLPLPRVTFESDGRTYPLLPGMRGRVDVPLGREPLLFAILPALGEWWDRRDA